MLLVEKTWLDQLGRARLSQDRSGNYVPKRYIIPAQSGFSYELTSNPYITGQESTMGWTRTKRDVQGRLVEVKHFSVSGCSPVLPLDCGPDALYVWNRYRNVVE